MLLEALWSLPRSTLKGSRLIWSTSFDQTHLWTDFNSSSETPISWRNLTVPRPVLNCSSWGSCTSWNEEENDFNKIQNIQFWEEIILKWITFATSRCLNALVPLSKGLDQLMWSPATSLFSDSKTYLRQQDVTIFPFDLSMASLCYRVEKSRWPSWRLILVWLSS